MGLSILVTTEEERADIALQLLPESRQLDNGGIKAKIRKSDKIPVKIEEISYDPRKDSYSITGTNIRGDLLDLYSHINNVTRAEGSAQFCDDFELDVDLFNLKKELMDHVGYVPNIANECLGTFFNDLSFITKEQAKRFAQQYGWQKSILTKFKVTMFQDGDVERICFPVYDKTGRTIIALRAVNPSCKPTIKHLGQSIVSPFLFPEISQLDKNDPILITQGYINCLSALSQDIDAIGIIDFKGELPVELLKKFEDRDVAVAFTASKSGAEYAIKLADALLPIAKSVQVVKWPKSIGITDTNGLKLYDYFVRHKGTVESLNDLMVPFKSNEPLPLRRELLQANEYPIEVLPPIIRDAVLEVSNALKCAPALAAQSFLAVSALSVQAHMNVEIDGRKSPSSCFFLTIAESGARKSSIDKIAMAPVFKREEELRIKIKEEMREYTMQMAVRKKLEADALKNPNPEAALRQLGPAPEQPLDASLTCEEPTYEGLVVKMVHGQPSIGIFSDEGGRFLGGAAMNKDNQQKTATGLSTIWDGKAITRTRVSGGSITLDGKRVSMHLMLQPNIADQLLGSDLLIGQGLMSRILIAYPPSNFGNREYSRINLKESTALKKFNKIIGEILSLKLPIKPGTVNELNPEVTELTEEAMERWIEFHNLVESDMKEGCQYSTIRGFAAKAAEHVLRLACVLTCVNDPYANDIPIEWVDSAIRIVEYHLSETVRLFNVTHDNPELKIAEQCLEFLRSRYPKFSLQELYQYGPMPVRDKQKSARIVKILEDHGWVRPIVGGEIIDFKKRRTAWEVVPE